MLDRRHRLTSSREFTSTVRHGRRAGARTVVVHVHSGAVVGRDDPTYPLRVGFVVGRAVGPAVVRNRVRRRLRHLMRAWLAEHGDSTWHSVVVVRALPSAADASFAELGTDLNRTLDRLDRAALEARRS